MDPWILAFPFDPPDLAKKKFEFCEQHRAFVRFWEVQIFGDSFFFDSVLIFYSVLMKFLIPVFIVSTAHKVFLNDNSCQKGC